MNTTRVGQAHMLRCAVPVSIGLATILLLLLAGLLTSDARSVISCRCVAAT